MKLTRQHFKLIADTLAHSIVTLNLLDNEKKELINIFIQSLKTTNTNFSSTRFSDYIEKTLNP
jgi:hypothetical protein